MRVGLIAPIKFLDKYCTTKVQYCLPKLLVESEAYRAFYTKRSSEGDQIILDTVKPEWRRIPEDWDIVEAALKIIRHSIVIYPSVMFDSQETINARRAFRAKFQDSSRIHIREGSIGVPCVEGTDSKDTLKYTQSSKSSGTFAIPSHMLGIIKKVSAHHVIYIENKSSIEELEGLEGILVTSLPIRLGMLGRFITDTKPIPPTLNFYEEKDTFPMVVAQNIKETLEYYGNS